MQVTVRPSWPGRLVGLPWKMPEIRLALGSAEGTPPEPRRVIPATATRPFPLVDPWPDSPEALSRLFSHSQPPGPPGLALFTSGPWAWRPAEVVFFEVQWKDPDLESALSDGREDQSSKSCAPSVGSATNRLEAGGSEIPCGA